MSKNFNLNEYVTVHERVEKFHVKHPQGRITTSILEHDSERGFILIRAEIFREQDDALPAATGHAYELRSSGYVQQGSYVEVCETSAVGRALALLGFEVKRGIASREEMQKASRMQETKPAAETAATTNASQPAATATTRPAPAAPTPTPRPTASSAPPAAPESDLDSLILQSAELLGYDAAKVRKWINQKFGVTGGLASLTDEDKREVLSVFREKAPPSTAKATTTKPR